MTCSPLPSLLLTQEASSKSTFPLGPLYTMPSAHTAGPASAITLPWFLFKCKAQLLLSPCHGFRSNARPSFRNHPAI
eukprot:1160811-Pelagomonas_calceolata.AAC.2